MARRTWRGSWQGAIELYHSLESPNWDHIRVFERVVAELATSREVEGLFAITSLSSLIITPHSKYPDFFDGRRVCLHPTPTGEVEIARYEQGSLHAAESYTLPVGSCRERILELVRDHL